MNAAQRALTATAVLTALMAIGFAARADVLADCKAAKSGEARIATCSEIIASKTAAAADRAEALRRRAQAYAERAANKEAAADYSAALGLEPASAPAYIGRAQSRLAINDLDGAITDLSEALRIGGKTARLFVARGYAHLLKGNAETAIADFTAAIALQPENASAYNNRGLANRKKGDVASALADYSSAIRLNPAYAQAYANRGYVYETQGNKPAAATDLRHALALDPSMTSAAAALKRIGEPGATMAESERLIARGRLLAQKNCAWCHAIGRSGDSPNPRAPRWRDISQQHPILPLREPLTRGIARPHDEMPKFELSNDEVDTIVAYINSLSP